MRFIRPRTRKHRSLHGFLLFSALFASLGLVLLSLRSIDPPVEGLPLPVHTQSGLAEPEVALEPEPSPESRRRSCATVEEMGEEAAADSGGGSWEESLRVRRLIQEHFALHGAPRVRGLPPEQFCGHSFVMGKSSEAGLGNEMYKILTAAGLSIMLNRSLIIGQTRGKFPFEDYVSYSNLTFTLKEVKHLWRQNGCVGKYGRRLVMRTDDFEKPKETNVLCSDWSKWQQPIIWFQGTTDAVALQFFLKNINPPIRNAASVLFGNPEILHSRPNVFGELMRAIISPSRDVEEAVTWALSGGPEPHLALHMRMLMNKSIRAVNAALNCIKKALLRNSPLSKPRVVLVSDSPSVIKDITPQLEEFAEVIHFDYKLFEGNISGRKAVGSQQLSFRVKDWGPAPRWVAFVDFFLASRAKYAIVSGAHKRVGTTYAQLIAALAAANQLDENNPGGTNFSFLSSFQSNLLSEGLRNQVGWGHAWNRFAGPLSCHNQLSQCAFTPLLPPGWWDGTLQSPIPRDVRRVAAYGVTVDGLGMVDETELRNFCSSRKEVLKTIPVSHNCSGLTCM